MAAKEEETGEDIAKLMPSLHKKKRWPKVTAIIVLMVVVAGAGFVYWHKNHTSEHTKSTASQSIKTPKYVAPPTTQYSSSNLDVTFNYPNSWTVTESVNNTLTVTSTAMELTTANSKTVLGKVVMTVQNEPGATINGFATGSALAVMASQIVTYQDPSSSQAAQTYLSFLQYATTTSSSGLDGIYVTGNYGYQSGQTIPESDISQVDPLITVTFTSCSNSSCQNTSPLTVSVSMWSEQDFAKPILAMLESLSLD
jgi:hypothetical protein